MKRGTKKDKEKSSFIPICYLYGKKGHIKPNCPLANKENKKKSKKPQKKSKKSYIS